MMADFERRLAKLEAEAERTKEENRILRIGEFENQRVQGKHKKRKDQTITNKRNTTTHGGHIIGDIDALETADDLGMEHFEDYKECFENTYDIEFELAQSALDTLPHEVEAAFNILGSVRRLDSWHTIEAQQNRLQVEKLAKHIIDSTISVTKPGEAQELFGPGGESEEIQREMKRIFLSGP